MTPPDETPGDHDEFLAHYGPEAQKILREQLFNDTHTAPPPRTASRSRKQPPTNKRAATSAQITPPGTEGESAVAATTENQSPQRAARTRKSTQATAAAAPIETHRKSTAESASPADPLPQPLLRQRESRREGVPPMYQDGTQWLHSGFRRHRPAVIVGLIFGWTGAWIAFWGAMGGAILGVLIGFGLSNRSLPVFTTFGAGQAVSVLTIIGGFILGAIGGFVAVIVFLCVHPLSLFGSFVAGVVLTVLLVAGSASFERLGLRMRGYRRLSRDEVRHVAPLVKSAADAMELPGLPRFAIADQVIPNAWTHMRTVVLTKGLLQTLDDGEIEAILIHELAHWGSGDAVGVRCVWAASWPVTVIYNLGSMINGDRPRNSMGLRVTVSSAFRPIIAWLIAWPAWIIVRVIIAPLMAASQRRYEYQADATAYTLHYGPQLSSALRKIGAFETGRTGWEAAMTATHPPVELRIEALQVPRPDDWEYQEEELRGPSWEEVSRIFGSFADPAHR